MTTAQMIDRKSLYHKVCGLSDGEAARVVALIDSFKRYDIDEHEPSAETIAAFREAEHPENLKSYTSIEEMFRDFGVNVDC
ncbi:hypothetical protein FACS1894167_15040 [Synergistales bacterium]|nr:hypothetical protein FACS1894167_15040 [Synergistales bacterium]